MEKIDEIKELNHIWQEQKDDRNDRIVIIMRKKD